jgi:hypothetical protein
MQTIFVSRGDLATTVGSGDWSLAVVWYASLIKGYGLRITSISGEYGAITIKINPNLPQADFDDLTNQANTLKSASATGVDREIKFKYVNGSEATLLALE